MSRGASEARRPALRQVDDFRGELSSGAIGTSVEQTFRTEAGPGPVTRTDDEAIMHAKTAVARDEIKWAEGAAAAPRAKAPLSLLGFAALGLWVLAVLLGIGAPLLGLDIDGRLVVGVLVASGVVSLLSLPVTACTTGPAKKREDGQGSDA